MFEEMLVERHKGPFFTPKFVGFVLEYQRASGFDEQVVEEIVKWCTPSVLASDKYWT